MNSRGRGRGGEELRPDIDSNYRSGIEKRNLQASHERNVLAMLSKNAG